MKKKEVLVEKVNEIISEYTMRLTLRQIYYRLVSKHIIENVMSQYKYLSKILVDARMNGDVPFNKIEDRTRRFIGGDIIYEDIEDYHNAWLDAYKNCSNSYKLPRWYDQPKYVEVWVEKEALSGLFKEITDDFNILLAPCRGYPSLTFMYEMASRLNHNQKEIEILYFGDFDPSGHDIYRIVKEYFAKFGIKANFEKIAITKEQIIEYDIPPMPTKKTDSRTANFIAEHGDIAVELDAIEPDILQQIIRDSIDWHFDNEIYEEVLEEQEDGKVRIKDMIKKKIKTN